MMVLSRHSVSSSVGFSPSPGGEARLFHEDQEPDGDRKPAALGRHSLGYPAGVSVIKSPILMESLTPPMDQYAGSIVDFIAFISLTPSRQAEVYTSIRGPMES